MLRSAGLDGSRPALKSGKKIEPFPIAPRRSWRAEEIA
jgi:hypothetical protein